MTWKPCPREGADQLALPLDAMQGYLLSRLDGFLDVPMLAALMNLEEDLVVEMLVQLVQLGAVQPEQLPAPAAPPQEGPVVEPDLEPTEDSAAPTGTEDPGEEETPLAAARTATHRQLFEQHLHHRPVDERVAQAQVAVEPDLSA